MPTADYLYEKLSQLRPHHRPWSLAELRAGEGVYRELIQWAAELGRYDFDFLAHQAPLKAGALLLWLHAEITRRHGHEGQLWMVLANRQKVPWQDQTWGRLYNPAGNLHASHGRLLERAARMLELRHAFDVEDANQWFRLIHLQFGFTHEDAKCRLKAWLSGQILPVAVQTLLHERDPGALEFQRMWHRLRQFRLGNVSKTGMQEHLKSCCWVLPEWTEDLLKAALAADVVPLADDEEDSVSQFHTSPQLKWDGQSVPSFSIELCYLNEIEAQNDLELRVQGMVLARLLKQKDGGFISDTEGALILGEGAALRSRLDLRLVTKDEAMVRQATVSLWDADAEVSLLRPSDGMGVVESQLRTGQAFDLITASDLTLQPMPAASTPIGAGYRLHRYENGWSGVIEARMDDLVLWTSAGFGKQSEPPPMETVRARWTQALDFTGTANHTWPWMVSLQVEVLDENWHIAGLRWTRADGKLMSFHAPPSELSLVEGDIARPVTLRVMLRHGSGRLATIPVKLPPPMQGCARWSEDGKPVIQRGDKTLLISEASRAMWSFMLPERRDGSGNVVTMEEQRCSFMEGDFVRGSVRSRAMILPRLGGYGAPAWISEDPYNGNQHTMEIASRVIDGGVIGHVRVDAESQKVIMTRLGAFDLTEKHEVLAWIALPEKPGGVVRLNPELLTSTASGWEFPFPQGGSLLALALLYEGSRLGSWFSSSRWSHALLHSPPAEPTQMAALLRVWKAPLLQSVGSENHRSQVVDWLQQHWMAVLPVWLTSKGTFSLPGIEQTPVLPLDSEWRRVVQALLIDLQPRISPEQAAAFVNGMAVLCSSQSSDERLGYSLIELSEACPLLAARTLTAALLSPLAESLKGRGKSVLALMRACFTCREDAATELAIRHGNRDSHWLRLSIPSLQSLEGGNMPLPLSYRRLSGSDEFRNFAFGVWLEEIRQRFHL